MKVFFFKREEEEEGKIGLQSEKLMVNSNTCYFNHSRLRVGVCHP